MVRVSLIPATNPYIADDEKFRGDCIGVVILVLIGATLLFCAITFSSHVFSYEFLDVYKESAKTMAEEVEMANFLVRQGFGKTDYIDRRLNLLKYNIVPRSRNCLRLHYFVIVHVRAADKLIREQWRRTYGQLQHEHNFTIIFATGLASNKSLNDDLMNEALIHGDLLQANFGDTYRNLTLKNIAALRYVAAVCPTVEAVVKLDDDVAWNIQGTKSVVDESIKDGRIRCMNSPGYAVPRDKEYRWHVTEEEYSGEYFPPHCVGFAYVMPRKAFWFILEATSEERFLWIDDVFVTGVLANKTRVELSPLWGQVSLYTKILTDSYWYPDSIFTLVHKEDMEQFFVITNAKWMLENFWYNEDNA